MALRERKVWKYTVSHRKLHVVFCSRIRGYWVQFSISRLNTSTAFKALDSPASAIKEVDLFVIAANNISSFAPFS